MCIIPFLYFYYLLFLNILYDFDASAWEEGSKYVFRMGRICSPELHFPHILSNCGRGPLGSRDSHGSVNCD